MYGQQPYSSSQSYDRMLAQMKRPAYGPWLLVVLLLGGAGYGAYWGYGERARLMDEANKGQQARQSLAALEDKVKVLEGEKSDLTKNVAAQASELATLKGAHDKLEEKMKEEIAKGEIQLFTADGKLRVDLVDKVLFDSGDAEISKRGQSVLLRVGTVLAGDNMADKQIQISGHTDNQPILSAKLRAQFPSNWELSMARALNVLLFLQDQAKVPAERLGASGYGEHHPIGSNKSTKGRARNRRIEILLTPGFVPQRVSQEKLKAQNKPAEAAAAAEPAKAPDKAAAAAEPAKTPDKAAAAEPAKTAPAAAAPAKAAPAPAPPAKAPDKVDKSDKPAKPVDKRTKAPSSRLSRGTRRA